MTNHPNFLFVSPKRGGILQSSGFLDLKSLIALSQACKANALDELSLIVLIENEITRNHGVKTMKEAIEYWRNVCRSKSLLKRWLERDSCSSTTAESIKVTHDMLSCALPYEVMFSKMLRTVSTKLEQLKLVNEKSKFGKTILHEATTKSCHLESMKLILALLPEPERLKAVDMRNNNGWTALHYAAQSGNTDSLKTILAVFPESERLKAVGLQNRDGNTVLHVAARSCNRESLEFILSLYPESERLHVVRMQNALGQTALHLSRGLGCLNTILSLYPESERLHAVRMQDEFGWTALHWAAWSGNSESINFLLSLFPESVRLQAVKMQDVLGNTVLHCAAQSGNFESIEAILALYPESERLQIFTMTNLCGETVLHCAAESNKIECITAILSLFPESQRLRVLQKRDQTGNTVLENMNGKTRDTIREWLSKPKRLALKRSHQSASQTTEGVDAEQPEVKKQR